MSSARRMWIPAAAGVAAAVVVFAVVLLATSGPAAGGSGAGAPGPAAAAPTTTASPAATTASGRRAVAAGRLVFAEMGCGSCHRLAAAGSSGPIGPVLDGVLPRHTRASLLAKIRTPGPGTIMPGDFAKRMTPAQLDALVAFLLAARGRGAG